MTSATSRLHAAWTGQAATAAGEQTSTAGRGIRSDSAVFDAAAGVLESLAGRLRDAQRSHQDLRQYLIDLSHRAALLLAVEPVDPGVGADLALAVLVEQAVRDGQTVVIGKDGNLYYSDQILIGQTGDAPEMTQPPGHDPREPDGTRWSGGYHPGSDADDAYTTSGDH